MHELDLEYWKKASEVRPSLFSFRSSKGTDGEAVRGHFGMEPGPHADSLNGPPVFIRARLAEIVAQHLKTKMLVRLQNPCN